MNYLFFFFKSGMLLQMHQCFMSNVTFPNSRNNVKCGKTLTYRLLVTNSRENCFGCSWKCGVSNLSMLKLMYRSIYSWHPSQVSSWRCVRSYVNGIQPSGNESQPKTLLIWMQQTAAAAHALKMSFQKWADSWGVQEGRASNSEGVCDL